jgi:hypothetical protein
MAVRLDVFRRSMISAEANTYMLRIAAKVINAFTVVRYQSIQPICQINSTVLAAL